MGSASETVGLPPVKQISRLRRMMSIRAGVFFIQHLTRGRWAQSNPAGSPTRSNAASLPGSWAINSKFLVSVGTLSANSLNSHLTTGWHSVVEGSSKQIREDDKDGRIGWVGHLDRIVGCISRHEVSRDQVSAGWHVEVVEAEGFVVAHPLVSGAHSFRCEGVGRERLSQRWVV